MADTPRLGLPEMLSGTSQKHVIFNEAMTTLDGLVVPLASTPTANGDVVIELTNNTTLTFKARGSDGVVRSATLTLA